MTDSSHASAHISDADLALIRKKAADSVDEAPPLSPEVAERIVAYLIELPRAIRNAS